MMSAVENTAQFVTVMIDDTNVAKIPAFHP